MAVTLLKITNMITVLLCVLVSQVKSQPDLTNEFFPAKILAHQKTLSENSDLYVTCSTFGFKKPSEVYVYLCKDDIITDKMKQKTSQNDSTFIIHRVTVRNSGNYSCVFSKREHSLSEVAVRGHNTIEILVIDISVAGPSTVNEEDDIVFTCAVAHPVQTLGECDFIHSYLVKNYSILQVQAFNVTQKEVTFTVKNAVMRDSGHYSCMVLPSRCIQEGEERLSGQNTVFLEVRGSFSLRVYMLFSLIVITTVLFLGLFFWRINKGGSCVFFNLCQSEQTDADALEEQQQQIQEDEEDVGAQHDGSFTTEDDSDESENQEVAEDVGETETAYDVIDDLRVRPVEGTVYSRPHR